MKKLLIIALFLISACSNNKNVINKTSIDLPEWINENKDLSAVGISSPSKGGLKYQIQMAELDAKGNLASKIGAEISRVTKNALRSANVNSQDDVEEFFAQATKEVVKDLPLSSVYRDKFFWAKDGTLYVRIILNPDAYSKFLEASEKSFEKRLKKAQLGRTNINEAEQATKAIFDELEKERK